MNSNYILPITIVLAGVLIAGAVFLAGRMGVTTPGGDGNGTTKVRPYDPEKDHILGNPNAQVKVVEYLDLECSYCKTFHTTMHQIMDYYGESGKVAWVVRHFPLAQIHSKAPAEAQAAECAAEQGGDAAFFRFIDKVFEVTPSNNGLDLSELPSIATAVGLNGTALNQCLSDGTYAKKVQDSYQEALAAGGQGTPYVFIMVGTDSVVLSGAQPYDSMRAAIDTLLGEITPAAPTQ